MEVIIAREIKQSVRGVEARVVCLRGSREWVGSCSPGCIGATDAFVLLPVILLAFTGAVGGGLAFGTAFKRVGELCLELECCELAWPSNGLEVERRKNLLAS